MAKAKKSKAAAKPAEHPEHAEGVKEIGSITDLVPDTRNANRGTERGAGLIEESLRSYGAGRSVLADRHGRLIAGNKTVEGAMNAGIERVRVVKTNGHELVVVQRTDLDLEEDAAARALAIVDNRAGQLSLEWDPAQLTGLATDYELDLNKLGISEKELAKLTGDAAAASEDGGGGAGESIDEKYEVVVECLGEEHQREVFEKLTAEGLSCRVLTI